MFIKNNESAVRKMVADSKLENYTPFENLLEAKKYKEAYLIMEGDYGGQIYLTIPVEKIQCSEKNLFDLLNYLDDLSWKYSEGAKLFYEKIKEKTIVAGGMGGGVITSDLWVHSDLEVYKDEIYKILNNKQ